MMIVDGERVICGSANCNERSMEYDTETALYTKSNGNHAMKEKILDCMLESLYENYGVEFIQEKLIKQGASLEIKSLTEIFESFHHQDFQQALHDHLCQKLDQHGKLGDTVFTNSETQGQAMFWGHVLPGIKPEHVPEQKNPFAAAMRKVSELLCPAAEHLRHAAR